MPPLQLTHLLHSSLPHVSVTGPSDLLVDVHHTIAKAGKHTVKYWMISPAVVLQKIVIDLGGVKPSYLGAPETISKTKLR